MPRAAIGIFDLIGDVSFGSATPVTTRERLMRTEDEITHTLGLLTPMNRESRAPGIRIVVPLPRNPEEKMLVALLSAFTNRVAITALAKRRRSDYVPPVRHPCIAVLHAAAIVAGCALTPGQLFAQSSACAEGQSVLWSQVPEQNWPATQSLLEEIQSIDNAFPRAEQDEEPLTPELPLSVDPAAERVLHALELDTLGRGAPSFAQEKPGICLTELDPSCVQDPGSSSSANVQHFERGSSLDQQNWIKPQPRTALLLYPRTQTAVGPQGVRSNLERPPGR